MNISVSTVIFFQVVFELLQFYVVNCCSAVLAHFLLDEKLQKMGMLGCLLCIVGSTIIVLHAPGERSIESVDEIWGLAVQPGIVMYLLYSFPLVFCKNGCLNFILACSHSISVIYSISCGGGVGIDLVLCSPIWPDQYIDLYWHLLNNWIFNCELLFSFLLCCL